VAVTVREEVADVMQTAQQAEAIGFDSLWAPAQL